MADKTLVTQYASAIPYITQALPAWVSSEYERQRLGAYDLYDDIYHSAPGQFRAILRGSDDSPILVPTAKRIVKTLSRYVGRDWGIDIQPSQGNISTELAIRTLGELFNREEVLGKFATGKREWMVRGDWVWFLSADPDKPAGSRISISCIDPRTYFPIIESDVIPNGDMERVVGQTIAEEVLGEDKKTLFIKRQRWLKYTHPEHPNYGQEIPDGGFDIYYDSVRLELRSWDDPEKQKIVQTLNPGVLLKGIKALPCYHIKNEPSTGEIYGRSILAGLEPILAGINQTITDEELAIAMAGLGMYWTDGGAPVDEDGNEVPWIIGPNRVAEVPQGSTFGRLAGVASVEPSQMHVKYLERSSYGTMGINEIALGDAAIAESGIALAIRMQPLFDAADDMNDAIDAIMNHMLYDLKQWLLVYEGIDLSAFDIVSVSSQDRLPFDRTAFFQELLAGYTNGWFSLDYVWEQLNERLGYEIDKATLLKQLNDDAERARAAFDPYSMRLGQELSDNAAET